MFIVKIRENHSSFSSEREREKSEPLPFRSAFLSPPNEHKVDENGISDPQEIGIGGNV
jgi:hypothetical protein